MIVHGEKLVSDYLRTHPAVSAITTSVVGTTPSSTTNPWIRVTLLDAANDPLSIPEHLINYMLQCDCFAGKEGGQPEANLLGRTVRAALDEMPGTHDGVVVSAVKFVGMARVPDDAFEPARERIALTTTVYLHA